ncbi:probable methyltransferase PMT12 [Selaginella moellendorffii]|nr:probable methyltransferase PMT12 [Selaginella moellendorffii]|eukprot:XP_002989056.2 probable methyltransferase PMT12 [Selaginella moellendorffii]
MIMGVFLPTPSNSHLGRYLWLVHRSRRSDGAHALFSLLIYRHVADQSMAAWIIGMLAIAGFLQISSTAQLNLSSNIEILGFLDGQGSVAIEGLIGIGKEESVAVAEVEEEIISSRLPQNSTSDNSRLRDLRRSISSQACKSIPTDSIPCQIEDESNSSSCERRRIENPCLVPLPRGYTRPDAWPSCVHKARAENIGNGDLARSTAAAIQMHGTKISFRSAELDAARKYVDELLQSLPGFEPRLALNLEAGVGSLSVEFDRHGILALSIASKKSRADAIQLVLERGFPGMVQSFARERLPYPSEAFDLIHCGSCSTSWARKRALHLFEADRILRRGGFFVWSNTGKEKLWNDMLKAAVSMCWILASRKNKVAIWQKPANNSCYQLQNHSVFCDPGSPPPDDTWGIPLQACISGPSKLAAASERRSWPTRLLNAMRLKTILSYNSLKLATVEAYEADLNYWKMLTDFYLTSLGPSRIREIRNVLDTNAGYGGFAAALASRNPALSWWVLNVSPVDNPHNHLANIFDRGLLGVYHDWCKALPMYPRSFDLVHASRLFSAKHNCSMVVILLEIDRLLRPGGFAIFRDDIGTLLEVKSIANALHWKTTIQDTDSGPQGKDKVMHSQKTSWQP